MTEERQKIAWAVLQGNLPAEELTSEEIEEIEDLVYDAVSAKLSSPLFSFTIH